MRRVTRKSHRTLLKERLTREQWADLQENNAFNIRGSDGNLYRIVLGEEAVRNDDTEYGYFLERDWAETETQGIDFEYAEALSRKVRLESDATEMTGTDTQRGIACQAQVEPSDTPLANGGDYNGAI